MQLCALVVDRKASVTSYRTSAHIGVLILRAAAAVDRRSLFALCLEWLIVCITIGTAVWAATWWAYALAVVVIATRQHALLILYHDAVHGHFARRPWLNDLLVNLFVGVPVLMPVEIYRPLHLQHHRALGTTDDPETRLLYARQHWNYRPLPPGKLVAQLLGDLLVVNGARTIAAWRDWQESKPPSDPGQGARRIPWPAVVPAIVWLTGIASWVVAAPLSATSVLALWVVPLLTLTQLLQKLRSYAEHSGGPYTTRDWPHWTYSWRPGLLGRLTLWPYRINLHREHHERPQLHWHELTRTQDEELLPGSSLWRLLAAPVYPRPPHTGT